jgi:uncharacterized damage-inducible protein DinB
MTAVNFRTLYDYTYWAYRRVWGCIETLTDAQFMQPVDYAFGSIRGQVVHTMSAEWLWFSRIRGNSPKAMLTETEYPDRNAVRAKWDTIETEIRGWLGSLTDPMLESMMSYQTVKGEPFTQPLWTILLHAVNHGTDHRAQTLFMLYRLGAPTVEQDFVFYWRQKN